jgi:AraC-like DNA-binding protein
MDSFDQHNPGRHHDQGFFPVSGRSADYASGLLGPPHCHPTAQLIHAVRGVMVVITDVGQWIVPPTHGVWMPPGIVHQLRMVGEVHLRTVYVRTGARHSLPTQCQVVDVSPLLRELILAAIDVAKPYDPDSRDGRLMDLLLDEVAVLPSLPLRLPYPSDPALITICRAISTAPDDPCTLSAWAGKLGINARTIQRRFSRQTGMTFGQWRQQARLGMALEQLACGTKIVDVALALGYDSPSAFATMFKRQFGTVPSDYFRRKAGAAAQC